MSPLSHLRILVALVLALFFVDQPLSQAQTIDELKAGVVKITATVDKQQRIGTGFIVRIEDDTAYIVTASHVVEGATLTINFFTNPDKGYGGITRNMQGANTKGLAVIKVQGPLPAGIRSLVIASNFEVKGGESAKVIGFRRSPPIPWGVFQGILTGQIGADLIVSGAVVNEGNSGGPILVNEKVVGVLTEVLDDIGYAVPASITQITLKGWGVRFEQGSSQVEEIVSSDSRKLDRMPDIPDQVSEISAEEIQLPLKGKIGKDGAPMVLVPAGEFTMGSPEGEGYSDERPQHTVGLDAFYISQYEVTFAQYDKFAQATGRNLPDDKAWGRGQRPVINISWGDAKAYAKWLSGQTGDQYRLPTEAEWEYVARSGGTEQVWAGTSNERQVGNYAVYVKNSEGKTAEVGSKQPNRLGLYDMSGNVFEWVEDCWHKNYQGAPTDGSARLEGGGGDCSLRVIRGGSWKLLPVGLRASDRAGGTAVFRYDFIGFRLAQDAP